MEKEDQIKRIEADLRETKTIFVATKERLTETEEHLRKIESKARSLEKRRANGG